jgi:hypothetical protein
LLSINRTRSGGDSYFAIDNLSSNSDLVVLVPSSQEAEPLLISVELDESDDVTTASDKTGWLRTRNRIQMSWRKRYFVLSEGTLSFYRHASPRPHGMRGQTVVTDASIPESMSSQSSQKMALKNVFFTLTILTSLSTGLMP